MVTRRQFLERTSATALSAMFPRTLAAAGGPVAAPVAYDPRLMPPVDEIWGHFETVNKSGPRYTGNDAHRKFIDWLESGVREARLTTSRDAYTFPRWEAKKWSLTATPTGGQSVPIPLTFYYPHSGQTGPAGVAARLVYVGKFTSDGSSKPDLARELKGKIALVDYEIAARDYNDWYQPYGFYTPDAKLEKYVSSVMAQPFEELAGYKKAGAAGVIIAWTNISDAHATGQNWPFGRPLQDIPAVLVGRDAGAKLRDLANAGGSATLTLEADVFKDAKTESLMATLPGSSDETLIVYTHTDGPNMVQENAGIGLVALAKYFSKVPQGSRKRTLVFAMVTGHDVGGYVPGTEGIIKNHPDVMQKTVGAVAVEHLGCRAWRDDASMKYAATGGDELTYAITNHQSVAGIVLANLPGTTERHCAVVKPKPAGRYLGLGGTLARTGLPTLGYYASPTYLNMVAPDGCLGKLSKPLMYGQLQALAKIIHTMDVTPAADLKGAATTSQR
jgi:hypothetical protein